MGPICGRQDPGGPHVGAMNFAIWVVYLVMWFRTARVKLWNINNSLLHNKPLLNEYTDQGCMAYEFIIVQFGDNIDQNV